MLRGCTLDLARRLPGDRGLKVDGDGWFDPSSSVCSATATMPLSVFHASVYLWGLKPECWEEGVWGLSPSSTFDDEVKLMFV
jgi:hypothetical protein